MRRIISLAFLAASFLSASVSVAAPPHWPEGVDPPPAYAPDKVLVGFHPGTPGSAISAAHRQAGGQVVKKLDAIGVQVVQVASGNVLDKIAVYEHNPNVLFAEPNYRRYIYLPTTNEGSEPTLGIDNNFTEQWGLENSGQAFGVTVDPLFGTVIPGAYTGVAGADISAPAGWAVVDPFDGPTLAGTGTKIAIIDSGIDCTHPDLMSGGVSKCVEQINFVSAPGVPLDDLIGHGTHVATIAAAYSDNGIGTAGVAGDASLGSLKVCYADPIYLSIGLVVGVCEDAAIADAILHAACVGGGGGCVPYHVINMSLAGPEDSATIGLAVTDAWNAGVVIVAGAANDYTQTLQYPAAYANVIGVAATDYFDNLASFSTFGNTWVSVAAPGHTIFSAMPNAMCGNPPEGCYDWLSGTSMSTPMVAGAAAVVWAHQGGSATNASVRSAIENGADMTGALEQNMQAWVQFGRLNLECALAPSACSGSDSAPNASVASPGAGATVSGMVTVQVSADDGEDPAGDLSVEVAIDGGGWQVAGYDAGYYEWDWDTSLETDASYTIDARAMDSFGNTTDASTITVTVDNASGGGITLSATGYKVKGVQHADLSWSSALTTNVDIYRDAVNITTTGDDGAYTDNIGGKGGGSYLYQVCEAGAPTCSDLVAVTF